MLGATLEGENGLPGQIFMNSMFSTKNTRPMAFPAKIVKGKPKNVSGNVELAKIFFDTKSLPQTKFLRFFMEIKRLKQRKSVLKPGFGISVSMIFTATNFYKTIKVFWHSALIIITSLLKMLF